MRTAESIMTKNPCCCTPETKLQEIARLMIKYDCGEIPVVDTQKDLRIMGVITDRDIVCRTIAKGLNPLDVSVADIMTFPPVTVTLYDSVEKCCVVMEMNRIRRVPVIDEFDRICGIISQADIVRRDEGHTIEVLREVSAPREHLSSFTAPNQ